MTVEEVIGKREILVSEKNNPPPYLARGIIGDRKPAEEFSTMPESMQVQVKVVMPGGNEVVMPLATMAGKRVSLVYVGAYPGHQAYIDSVGGIHNLRHPYTGAIVMKPVSLLQKHMKPHCVHYILYRDIGYGTLCSTALSIGVVSARGSGTTN